jgi:hypothetical protein
MQIVWYWAGYHEKTTHRFNNQQNGTLRILYETKEMRLALFLAVLSIAGLSLAQTFGPFDYMSEQGDITMRIAPCAFLLLAVTGTLWIQDNIILEDEYGKEQRPTDLTTKDGIIKNATRITGGKLAVSILLIVFGFLVESNVIGEYFRGLRAYTAKIPDRAWQFDSANRYTIGTGFLPSSTLYL